MVSYETIPADPAEDGLLATPKPKTTLKRILVTETITTSFRAMASASYDDVVESQQRCPRSPSPPSPPSPPPY